MKKITPKTNLIVLRTKEKSKVINQQNCRKRQNNCSSILGSEYGSVKY